MEINSHKQDGWEICKQNPEKLSVYKKKVKTNKIF